MLIHEVIFYAMQGGCNESGKRRPKAFEPYCVISGFPEIPKEYPYRAIPRPGGILYFREYEGSANFFLHTPRDEHGFGGAVFSGVLENGEPFSVKGPWSSSCETVNGLGLPSEPLAHIAVREPEKPHSWGARFVTLAILRQVANLVPDWRLVTPEPRAVEEAPWSSGASDEQIRVIEDGRQIAVPHFIPIRDLEDCPGCGGFGSTQGPKCEACEGSGRDHRFPRSKCLKCYGKGFLTLPCEICGRRFCNSGIAPYPNLNMGNRF